MSSESDPVRIFISVDEWRDISTWMHASLERDELAPHGHFLLECCGTRRTWVTSDGAQITVVRGDGPAPRGLPDPEEPFCVLVNSRFFRGGPAQDGELTVTVTEVGRLQTFETGGISMTLPEQPGQFGDWREILEGVSGPEIEVEAALLRDACVAASVVPFGIEMKGRVLTWVSASDGRLHLQSPWADYPSTAIDVPLARGGGETAPVLVDIVRLFDLVAAVDADCVVLVMPTEPTAPLGIRAGRYQAALMPVDRWGEERARLEQLLCEFLGTDSVSADHDGDYPVDTPEGHRMWVRLQTEAGPVNVQVFSVLADHVDPPPALFEELNSINASAAHVKVLWAAGAVMAEVDLVAEALAMSELGNALNVVRRTAERYRDVLSAFFGGDAKAPGAE